MTNVLLVIALLLGAVITSTVLWYQLRILTRSSVTLTAVLQIQSQLVQSVLPSLACPVLHPAERFFMTGSLPDWEATRHSCAIRNAGTGPAFYCRGVVSSAVKPDTQYLFSTPLPLLVAGTAMDGWKQGKITTAVTIANYTIVPSSKPTSQQRNRGIHRIELRMILTWRDMQHRRHIAIYDASPSGDWDLVFAANNIAQDLQDLEEERTSQQTSPALPAITAFSATPSETML